MTSDKPALGKHNYTKSKSKPYGVQVLENMIRSLHMSEKRPNLLRISPTLNLLLTFSALVLPAV